MRCETRLCCAPAEVRLSWCTSRGLETLALCLGHARILSGELKKFGGGETLIISELQDAKRLAP